MTDTENPDVSDEDLALLRDALGGPRDPDSLARHLDSSFTMASRRRVTLAVLAALAGVALVAVAIWAVVNDSGLDFGTGSASFSSSVSTDGFETEQLAGASDTPDLSTASSSPLNQTVAVTNGSGPASDRIVEQPDPALFTIQPGTVTASLITFRSAPAVAILGPADWFATTCVQITPVGSDAEPAAPLWVASEIGACGGLARGTGVVPACTGPRGMIVRLPQTPVIASDNPEAVGAVTVDVFTPDPDYETLLVTGTVPATGGLGSWPAALGDDGATVTMNAAPAAAGGGTAACVVG
jgi:hypothetical protein